MVWVLNSKEEVLAVQELATISDRAAAIVAAALLENRIERSLKFHLVDHRKNAGASVHLDMFRSSGPLGSFSAKINMGYMIGLYSAGAWKDLDYIREIRNVFAHKIENRAFDSVSDLCKNITWFQQFVFPRGTREAETPQHLSTKMYEEDLQGQLEDPRKRYLLAVRFYLASSFTYPDGARADRSLLTPNI